jgi:hypothetical protein
MEDKKEEMERIDQNGISLMCGRIVRWHSILFGAEGW